MVEICFSISGIRLQSRDFSLDFWDFYDRINMHL